MTDDWDMEVDSWRHIHYDFDKTPLIKDERDWYLQYISRKYYILTDNPLNAVTKLPVKLVTVKRFSEIYKLSKNTRIRQFCFYQGIYYSGKTKTNTRLSTKKRFPFVFIFDDTCKLKLENLSDIRIQEIRVGRPKRGS